MPCYRDNDSTAVPGSSFFIPYEMQVERKYAELRQGLKKVQSACSCAVNLELVRSSDM